MIDDDNGESMEPMKERFVGQTNQDAISGKETHVGPQNHTWGAHWRHLANTTTCSVRSGDAASCQVILTLVRYVVVSTITLSPLALLIARNGLSTRRTRRALTASNWSFLRQQTFNLLNYRHLTEMKGLRIIVRVSRTAKKTNEWVLNKVME